MDFLTTKQVAERWGITPKRVTVLAGQGRIPGAKRMDGRWFIPENAVKPADPRGRGKSPSPCKDENYLFPFPMCVIKSEDQVAGFMADQQELYRANLLFEKGSLAEARVLAERLLSSEDRYVRIGALYLLPLICMSLQDFPAAEKYSVLFHDICLGEKKHRADIDTLLIELDGEMSSYSKFIENVGTMDTKACSPELLPFISAYKILAVVSAYRMENIRPDISAYEILCREFERQGWFYDSIFIHFYLSLYYVLSRETESALDHLKKSFDIAVGHDTLFTLSGVMFYNREMADRVLADYPPVLAQRMEGLSELQLKSRNAFSAYLGKKAILGRLDQNDRKLLSYCLTNCSIGQMAEHFGLSRSGINKRLSSLYSKLGVTSKKDLDREFVESALNWK